MVFLCVDLLTVSIEPSAASKKAERFFQIAQELPIEVQMVLCNRNFGAGKDAILAKHSEPAFKRLGKLLTKEDCH